MRRIALLALISTAAAEPLPLPDKGLVIDLDAAKGLKVEDGDKVAAWTNQAEVAPTAKEFVKRDEGRKEPGSGRPSLLKAAPGLNRKPALDFRQQELVCLDEDAFDGLSTGKGHTWIAVLAVHEQRVGLKDVNSFFGNLRNGEKYEGIWGCLNDDNTPWWGARNGITFGRFDENNPKLEGPKLETGKFQVLAGRMAAGSGTVDLEFFVGDTKPAATAKIAVNAAANPSRMALGQERDATNHPGVESFDGQIARFLVWQRPLTDEELAACFKTLKESYLEEE